MVHHESLPGEAEQGFDDTQLRVRFVPTVHSFVKLPGVASLWEAPERFAIGVYAWALPFDGGYLLSYVGKTSCKGGFEARLWQELRDWRKGHYTAAVDIELFLRGRRVEIEMAEGADRDRQLARQRELLEPKYRILLAPLKSDEECRHVEATIVDRLRHDPVTWQFVSNRDRDRGYRPAPVPRVVFDSAVPIFGLTAPTPPGLRHEFGADRESA